MILDILFPKRCFGCSKYGAYICALCAKQVVYLGDDICVYCQRKSYGGLTHGNCKRLTALDAYIGIFKYQGIMRTIVKSLKYRLIRDGFKETFQLIRPEHLQRFIIFSQNNPNCFLQPIPLHTRRENMRGFNQSHIIAKFFAERCNYPVVNLLRRIRNTPPQARLLTRKERRENIRDAFSVIDTDLIKGKTIILVDDVVTSGNTANEAASILKKHGVDKVFLWSLAHG